MKQPDKNQTYGQSESNPANSDSSDSDSQPLTDKALVCTNCGALEQQGVWTWNQLPANKVAEGVCPACVRIKDENAAGYVILTGNYVQNNRDQLITLITNIATSELSEHPLERLIDINDSQGSIIVRTTGIIIARRIGYALNIAFQGKLETTMTGRENIHIIWNREE